MTLLKFAPALFVFLWASGFVGARYAMPWAEPFSFLVVRYVLAMVFMAVLIGLAGRSLRWSRGAIVHSAIAGILLHGVYLGGVFWSIDHGMPAGLTALLVGLHPLITALFAGPLLGEAVSPRHWIGLFVGFAGVALVLSPGFDAFVDGVDAATFSAAFIAVCGLSSGSLWQKRFVRQDDLLTGTFYQYLGALLFTVVLAALFEDQVYTLTGELVFAMLWLLLVLSIGAILLLMLLIREGQASKVASLFYLVPAVTAVQAWILFGETLTLVQMAGMAIAAFGVALALDPFSGRRRGPAHPDSAGSPR
ncbi:MAG: DMT family transporter [Rhizobiaceae bacterium]